MQLSIPDLRRTWRGGWRILLGGVGFLLLLVGVLVQLGLKGARGHLPAFIDGQRDPGPSLDDSEVSSHPPEDAETYRVQVTIDPDTVVHTTDVRYLSFAMDTSAVVGGKWWDPEAAGAEGGSGTVHAPVFDFERERLDTLTRGLAPAYLRIGGSEADKLYYAMDLASDVDPIPPEGFESVMTPHQWDSVHAFAERNRLDVVMTLNAGPAVRDEAGVWQSDNTETLLAYTQAKGYRVAIWELGNELNLFWYVHGLRTQVSASQYQADLVRLRAVLQTYSPKALVSGQGAAFWPVLGEPLNALFGFQSEYLERSGQDTDLVSWHFYPQQSRRGPIASRRAYPGRLLDPHNLDEAAHWADHNSALRDRWSPGTPIWLAETGNAQFGGEPGLSDRYLASLWWMDQLGLMAQHAHDVVVRQTLAGSNYQLVTDSTLEPLPDYWASLLWKRLMGPQVLALSLRGSSKTRGYAHRAPNGEGVSVLLINLDHERPARVDLPSLPGTRKVFAVTADDLFGTEVKLNGVTLGMIDDRTLPELPGERIPDEQASIVVNPLSYSFVAFSTSDPNPP